MARGFLRPEAVGKGPGEAFLLPLVGVANGRRNGSGHGRAVKYVVLVASVVVVVLVVFVVSSSLSPSPLSSSSPS